MTQHRVEPSQPPLFDRWGHVAIAVVLVLAFVTGGGSRDRGLGDAITQLLALPLAVWAVLALHASTEASAGLRRVAVAVALLIVATLLVQQLPLPEGLWRSVAPRDALAADLQFAAVETHRVWSLSPLASERGLWSIMPALAVFLGALALPAQRHRPLLLLVVGLATASLALGFLQLGAPQDSLLNPFPEWAPVLGGFFANPNHQATALAIAIVTIAALVMADHREAMPAMSRWARFSLLALAVILLAALPLTGSRAVLLLTVLALVAIPVVLRRGRGHGPSASAAGRRSVQLALGLVALGAIFAAAGWLRFDAAQEGRWSVATVAAAMGGAHAPLGAGTGSFVSWFGQAAPEDMVMSAYYHNHAHNEYAQWWLESGLLGVASFLSVIAMLLVCYPMRRAARAPRGDGGAAVAAWLGCTLVLAHSWVDYPLRTPALMTVAALLAGIVVAQRVARTSGRVDNHPAPAT